MPDRESASQWVRSGVRTALAMVLATTAQGLSAAGQAAGVAARQLRPPEPASSAHRAAPDEPAPDEPAPDGPAPDGPAPEPPAGPGPQPVAPDAAASGPSGGALFDLSHLASQNAREVIETVPALTPEELRRLRTHESAGKARKTVLSAIDQALSG